MKILIPYDGSGTSRTLIRDLQISGLPEQADVFIISVAEIWLPPKNSKTKSNLSLDNDISEYFQQHSEQISRNFAKTEEILSEAKTQLQKYFTRWNIQTEVLASDSVAGSILLKTNEFEADLIVIGSQGLSWDGHRRLGSISQKVLTESNCSIRIARTKRDTDSQHLKIAICFDGSKGSLEAVKTFALRKWHFQPEIRLLVVSDPLTALIPGRAFQVIAGLPEGKMKGEIKWIESLATKALDILESMGLNASLHIYSGNPRMVLINETDDWGADLIFVGVNSDPSETDSLGSVASAVTVRASCTVEVVRN